MSKTTKAIATVMILLLISRLFGFIREMIIAIYYGASYQTDAYNMAITITKFTITFMSVIGTTVLIPIYNYKQIHQNIKEADLFVNNILWITSLFCLIISGFGIFFSPVLVKVFAPNFDAETVAKTIKIIRITFIFTVSINISNFMIAILQINKKFAVIILSNFQLTLFPVVSVVFLSDSLGIYALVIGYVLSLITQAFFLVMSARRVFKFKAVLNFVNSDLKDVFKLSFPVYISVAILEINMLIEKILASSLSEGSISAMGYASKLRTVPDGIITASVITVVFPLLSTYAENKEFDKLKIITSKVISLLFMSLLPVILISVYYAEDIIKIVYERGIFTAKQTALTANIFTYTIISLIFSGCAGLLNNLFYSMRNTSSPQIAAVIMLLTNTTLNLIFIRYMQAAGLALANSIASFVYFIMLSIQCRLKYGTFGELTLLKNIFKYILSATGVIPIFFLCEMLREGLPLLAFFLVVTIASLCIYALMLFLLKAELFIEGCIQLKKFLRGRLNRD